MRKTSKSDPTMARPVGLYIYKNGVLDYRHKGDPTKEVDGALLVGTVHTQEDAEELQIMLCKRTFDDPPLMRLPWPSEAEMDDPEKANTILHAAKDMLLAVYRHRKNGVTGSALAQPFQDFKQEFGLL